MFWAKTIGNYTVKLEINDRYLFCFDVREWPTNLELPPAKETPEEMAALRETATWIREQKQTGNAIRGC